VKFRVLVVTDAFPPHCDGSGWSTYHLARALADEGHDVRVIKPEPHLAGLRRRAYEGLEVTDYGFPYVDQPYVRNLLKNDLLYPRLRDFLVGELRARPADVVHAQHVLSAPPSIAAARTLGLPSVVTVRDHWPICYFTTWHVAGERCPDCSFRKMLACMKGKEPRGYWAGIPMMPYMRRNVRAKQRSLREASAVVAVSRYIASQVLQPILPANRIRIIANFVDVDEIDATAAAAPAVELPERFLLFAGKLYTLKGAHFVLDAVAQRRWSVPLVVIGDGPERAAMHERVKREGLDVRFLPWLDNAEVWRVMRRADAVLVPSLLHEALSRTVLEAMAVATPVAATDSGGIHDQLVDGESGVVTAADAAVFAQRVAALEVDQTLRARLASRARDEVLTRFDRRAVVRRVVALYDEVVSATKSERTNTMPTTR
jgi:glycosyltransferase involved in cell wall biosynthesis